MLAIKVLGNIVQFLQKQIVPFLKMAGDTTENVQNPKFLK